jgi:hypothetical protein
MTAIKSVLDVIGTVLLWMLIVVLYTFDLTWPFWVLVLRGSKRKDPPPK